jgi:formylglycine-generating enzyme required for sulfatase activity
VLKAPRKTDGRGRQRLRVMTAVGLVVLLQPHRAGTSSKEENPVIAAPAPGRAAQRPLDTFTDCRDCPEMVMIPGGSFMMGSPADEPTRKPDEGPQHRVTIKAFAMGKTEVTFTEWDACVAAGACNGYRPPDLIGGAPGAGGGGRPRGERPVTHVSWDDAKAYVSWLSRHTGEPYRLPSEAEWEYAARAGTTTLYSFGNGIRIDQANCSRDQVGPTEVGSYRPNSWGLSDMHGNVEEWVEDSWEIPPLKGYGNYEGAPTDGASIVPTVKDPEIRMCALRGGSWRATPVLSQEPRIIQQCRSAARHKLPQGARDEEIGFRVVRTLR